VILIHNPLAKGVVLFVLYFGLILRYRVSSFLCLILQDIIMQATQQTDTDLALHNPLQFTNNMMEAVQEWQAIMQILSGHQLFEGANPSLGEQEMALIAESFTGAMQKLAADPQKMMDMGMEMWRDYAELWQSSTQRFLGQGAEEAGATSAKDRRFKDEAWQQNPFFDFVRQSYLLGSKWMHKMVAEGESGDVHAAKKVEFYTRQFIDAMSPSNFLMTNPEVLRAMLETNGENLVKGLRNMRRDIERGEGKLRISMTDENAFELGRNLAVTPGKVVFQNDLMQLIQYAPSTPKAHSTPLLLIPAWINKYYVLDMREENSFVKWLVDQGHTVFMISWVNPSEAHRDKRFEDYMSEGVLEALAAVEKQTGAKQTSLIGYCLGGTLLACTLAYLHAKKQEKRVASATYLTTMIDFADAGELSVFIDEDQIQLLEAKMSEKGYLDGFEMANTFSMLRANDLIWSFFVNNYLLGKDPFPFDLLYWNADCTRMPAKMHSFYLRNMYQRNRLVEPGGIELAGESIDITRITTPSYILACREDHIAPWASTYAATHLYKGDVTFTLSASGHIAGVVNPPAKNKYCHWTNKNVSGSAENWLSGATQQEGSWWPHWDKWQQTYAGKEHTALNPEKGVLKPLEDAPGSYVKGRS
jgi:polyhydroxyalkanoate synthase